MVNMSNAKIELKCNQCNQPFKIKLGKLVRKKTVKCEACSKPISFESHTHEHYTYRETNPFPDLESAVFGRLN